MEKKYLVELRNEDTVEIMSVPLYYIIWTNLYIVNRTPPTSVPSSIITIASYLCIISAIFLIFHALFNGLETS